MAPGQETAGPKSECQLKGGEHPATLWRAGELSVPLLRLPSSLWAAGSALLGSREEGVRRFGGEPGGWENLPDVGAGWTLLWSQSSLLAQFTKGWDVSWPS